jgi:hypothetical protein
MQRDNDQPDRWKIIVSHRARDEVLITFLLFVCVLQFVSQAAGINLVQDFENVLRGWISQPAALLKWGGLIIAIAIYFSLIYDTRRLEVSNLVATERVDLARSRAYATLEAVEKTSADWKAVRGATGAVGADPVAHRTPEN